MKENGAHCTVPIASVDSLIPSKLTSTLQDNFKDASSAFIKIDTEGMDELVIRGMSSLLQEQRGTYEDGSPRYLVNFFQFEYSPLLMSLAKEREGFHEYDLKTVTAFLESIGFESFLIGPRYLPLSNGSWHDDFRTFTEDPRNNDGKKDTYPDFAGVCGDWCGEIEGPSFTADIFVIRSSHPKATEIKVALGACQESKDFDIKDPQYSLSDPQTYVEAKAEEEEEEAGEEKAEEEKKAEAGEEKNEKAEVGQEKTEEEKKAEAEEEEQQAGEEKAEEEKKAEAGEADNSSQSHFSAILALSASGSPEEEKNEKAEVGEEKTEEKKKAEAEEEEEEAAEEKAEEEKKAEAGEEKNEKAEVAEEKTEEKKKAEAIDRAQKKIEELEKELASLQISHQSIGGEKELEGNKDKIGKKGVQKGAALVQEGVEEDEEDEDDEEDEAEQDEEGAGAPEYEDDEAGA